MGSGRAPSQYWLENTKTLLCSAASRLSKNSQAHADTGMVVMTFMFLFCFYFYLSITFVVASVCACSMCNVPPFCSLSSFYRILPGFGCNGHPVVQCFLVGKMVFRRTRDSCGTSFECTNSRTGEAAAARGLDSSRGCCIPGHCRRKSNAVSHND